MGKRVVVSTVATVHPSEPFESFLFGFSCSGMIAREVLSLIHGPESGSRKPVESWMNIFTHKGAN